MPGRGWWLFVVLVLFVAGIVLVAAAPLRPDPAPEPPTPAADSLPPTPVAGSLPDPASSPGSGPARPRPPSSTSLEPLPAPRRGEAVLLGRIRILRDGRPSAERLRVEVVPSASRAVVERGYLPLPDRRPPVVLRRIVPSDVPFRIEVPGEGEYLLRVAVDGVGNEGRLTLTTGEPRDATLRIADALELELDTRRLGGSLEVLWGMEARLPARQREAGRWRVTQAVFLPVQLGIRTSASPTSWWTPVDRQDMRLEAPVPDGAEVVIREIGTERPVPGARLTASFADAAARSGLVFWSLESVASARGTSVLPTTGSFWTCTVRATGYAPAVIPSGAALRSLPRDAEGRTLVSLFPRGRPGGRLLDHAGNPVAGASLLMADTFGVVGQMAGDTRPSGHFTLEPGHPGVPRSRPLPLRADERTCLGILVVERDGTRTLLGPLPWDDLQSGAWEASLPGPPVAWTVAALDDTTGLGIPGASVRLVPLSGGQRLAHLSGRGRARTDESGRAWLGSVRGGPWELEFRAPGYVPRRVQALPEAGSVLVTRLEPARGRVRVRLVDSEGHPIAGRQLQLWSQNSPSQGATVVTDETGRVECVAEPGVSFGYACPLAPGERWIESNPGVLVSDGTERDLVLVPARVIRFDPRTESGLPVSEALVAWRPAGRDGPWLLESWNPRAAALSLPREALDVIVCAAGHVPLRTTWDAAVSGRLTTVLTAGARIHGRLVDAAGRPRPGLTILAAPREQDLPPGVRAAWRARVASATTDADGRFALGPLAPATWVLQRADAAADDPLARVSLTADLDAGDLVAP